MIFARVVAPSCLGHLPTDYLYFVVRFIFQGMEQGRAAFGKIPFIHKPPHKNLGIATLFLGLHRYFNRLKFFGIKTLGIGLPKVPDANEYAKKFLICS